MLLNWGRFDSLGHLANLETFVVFTNGGRETRCSSPNSIGDAPLEDTPSQLAVVPRAEALIYENGTATSGPADQTGGVAGQPGGAPTLFPRPPESSIPMLQQHDPGQLHKGLSDVEIAQWADLEERHTQALWAGLGLLCGDLPPEGQVQGGPPPGS